MLYSPRYRSHSDTDRGDTGPGRDWAVAHDSDRTAAARKVAANKVRGISGSLWRRSQYDFCGFIFECKTLLDEVRADALQGFFRGGHIAFVPLKGINVDFFVATFDGLEIVVEPDGSISRLDAARGFTIETVAKIVVESERA